MKDAGKIPDMRMRDTTCPQPGQIALYRFYDADDSLLYVGFSNEPWRRRKEHSVTQPWYPRVKHQAITWYDGEAAARNAELRAIRTESPEFNVAGALKPLASHPTVGIRFRVSPKIFPVIGWIWMIILPATSFVAAMFVPGLRLAAGAIWASMVIPSGAMFFACAAPWLREFFAWVEANFFVPSGGAR